MEKMEYRKQPAGPHVNVKPRLIIHGGAGNITPEKLGPEKYRQYQHALLTIVRSIPLPIFFSFPSKLIDSTGLNGRHLHAHTLPPSQGQ